MSNELRFVLIALVIIAVVALCFLADENNNRRR
jgi:FtsZ-interacting cell division protein ZipA